MFLFVPLSAGLINWSFSLTGLTTFQDALHTFPFFTRLRRRTSPSQSSRAGAPGQVQKVAARSSSHGKMSSPCELDKTSFSGRKLASRHGRKPVILKFSGMYVLLVVGPLSTASWTADNFRAVGGKFEGQFERQFEGGRRSVCDSSANLG